MSCQLHFSVAWLIVTRYDCSYRVIDSCPVTREEQEVAEAIKALRAELDESQQQFSDRLGVVVRTIARYELEKPPGGEVLSRLATIARDAKRPDLQLVFTNAFWRELNDQIGRKLKIEVPRVQAHYKALLWLTLNGGQRSQDRMDAFLKAEIARVAKERRRELDREERQSLGSLAGA